MAAMKSPSVRTAVLIGYGSMGRYHAALLLDRYEELAILDSNDQARVQASISYPKAIVAAGLSELDSIKWEWGNTLAVIATWGPSHAALFTDLANRGVKRVLCEKPLAHSVKAGAEMVREAEKQGIALGIHQHVRYSELVNGLHSLSKSLAIGEPCGIFIHGGAAGLITNGIHLIDLATELFGRAPESVVSSVTGEPINPRSSELMFYGGTSAWSFGDGKEAAFCFTNLSSVTPSVIVYYRDAVLEIELWSLDIRIRTRVPGEVEKFPAITRTGHPVQEVFKGPVPGLRSLEERTTALLDEIEAGDIVLFPPLLALQALGASIGALSAGNNRCLVSLPIEPDSDLGRTEWPIS